MLDISKFNGVSVSRYFKVLETLIAEYCKVSISWVLVEIPDYKMLQTNFFTWIQNLMTLTITSTGFGFLVTVDETLTGNPLAALLYNIFSSNPILHVFVNIEKEHFFVILTKWNGGRKIVFVSFLQIPIGNLNNMKPAMGCVRKTEATLVGWPAGC